MKKIIFACIVTLAFSCENKAQTNKEQEAIMNTKPVEVSIKNGKAKAVKLSTLEAICVALDCQPGDILEFRKE